jgi:dextranase
VAYDAEGELVDLPHAFAAFVASLKDSHPGAAVLFNAVGNWPIEALAASPQDFAYVEIWPPAAGYEELHEVIVGARRLSGGKPVVIALYIPADHPHNILLADALIFASGGTRIELGENGRLLTDPYFPKHQALSPGLKRRLRSYYDFVVRYGDLFGPPASDPVGVAPKVPDGVWAVPRTSRGWLTVGLINTTGLGDPRWDEAHPGPEPRREFWVGVPVQEQVRQVWWASPDRESLRLKPVPWGPDQGAVRAAIPCLDVWGLLALELETAE